MIIQRVSVMFSNQTIAFEEKLSHTHTRRTKKILAFLEVSPLFYKKILESLTKK